MTIAQVQSGARPAARASAGEPQAASSDGDFAQLMALQAPPGDTPPPARPDEARNTRARQAARGTPRMAQPEARAEARTEARTDTPEVTPTRPETTRSVRGDEAATPAVDAALAQWLAPLHRPDAPSEAPPASGDTTGLLESATRHQGLPGTVPVSAPPSAAAQGAPAVSIDGRASHGQPAVRPLDKSTREAASPLELNGERARDEAAAPAGAGPREPVPGTQTSGFTLPAGFEPVATAAPGAPPSLAQTPVVAVPIAVPLESPEFAEAFGVEISVLARDGVQQAELHLNPAEMGPVSVQIALDGEKARIDFGAQASATRAAIEASLPELAAALRDAGLTLAGGGVSQHAGQRGDRQRDGEDSAARPALRDRPDGVTATPARPAWRSRSGPGGVDLYA